jgi:hypothetical protein
MVVTTVISAFWSLKLEDHEFEASLLYIVSSRPALATGETLSKNKT